MGDRVLKYVLDSRNLPDEPGENEGNHGADDADEEELAEGPHPDVVREILQHQHQQHMEHVGAVRLLGAPAPEPAAPVRVFAEQPQQSEGNEDAHQRLVNAEPAPDEPVPDPVAADVIAEDEQGAERQRDRARAVVHLLEPAASPGQDADDEHHHILQIMSRFYRHWNDSERPDPMVLRTHLPDEVSAGAHDQADAQQRPERKPLHAAALECWHELPDQGIDEAEHQQALHEPHVPGLELPRQDRQEPAHHQQRNAEPDQFLPNEGLPAVPVITLRYEVARNQEVQPHEETRIGREEMPDPRHELGGIAGRIGPSATGTIGLSRMVEDHQHGKKDLEIIQVVLSVCLA